MSVTLNYEELFAANKEMLAQLLPEKLRSPRVGIVCGSGLSTLAATLRETVEVPYSSLRGFGKSTGMCCSRLAWKMILICA